MSEPTKGRGWRAKQKGAKATVTDRPWRKRHNGATTKRKGEGFTPKKIENQHAAAKAQLVVKPVSISGRPITLIEDAKGRHTVSIEDLREDMISVVRNSHLTSEQIRERGGPAASTINNILERKTQRPQLNTIRSALLVCDFDLAVVPRREPKPDKDVDSQ